jgi:hypothetical protein
VLATLSKAPGTIHVIELSDYDWWLQRAGHRCTDK